ncbi:hypothetical protein NBRC116601_03260 [Cognatishimia sp. WU-CL00825]
MLLFLISLFGTIAHLKVTWSLQFVPSAAPAPFAYIEIPITTLVGFLIFSDLPNGIAALGILISVSARLSFKLRERAKHRALQAKPAPRFPART